ncbi:DUF11 domain-containing protein [Stieleria sp. JC731]|uniref:DUF11 domain-containing protein n=1 Tax=Pirellulaceae TaxID=2691357 RepID=UPI001E369063|nr:DUF11 domain-containing protein [Stieleria sp. JC731]MCC9601738.1 DUF11 domain-containing protein [Stieleria sp. JC731]
MLSIAIAFACFGGCSRLRLPAVDPTGRRIFNPLPTTTELALPGAGGECKLGNCLKKLGDPLNLQPFKLPEPAFTQPTNPPACITPPAIAPSTTVPQGTIGVPPTGNCNTQPCVNGPACPGDCLNGPPAILIGNETGLRNGCCLPNRGKRGCILLTPQKIVAPVGGEVILLSGICGEGGYLQMGEPLEWMLTPDSVGTFIQVGDDDPGLVHKLARIKKAEKHDPSYAFGVTSTKRVKITRGNMNPNDDIQLEKGQTWISISSPSEGTSHVTVLAPDSECWDQRKATATIYWVDASVQFPKNEILPAGQPVTLTTRVTRSEGALPARGWKVIYRSLHPELGLFQSPAGGSPKAEVIVDQDGNAPVQLIPVPGTSGTATIEMTVVRPGGDIDNMPPLELFKGHTFVTWSAPQLLLETVGPEVASFGTPFKVVARVSNPGDQTAQNVRVILTLPQGVRAQDTESDFVQNLPNALVWNIGDLPAKQQIDLSADVVTESSMVLPFEARADGGLVSTSTVNVDVYRPSLVLTVTPREASHIAGQPVEFEIDVTNTGTRPLENVQLFAQGDSEMLHQESNSKLVKLQKNDGPLQPGQTWSDALVAFVPLSAGRRCIDVEVTADGGQRAAEQSCVTVINQPVATPSLAVTLDGRSRMSVGGQELFRTVVVNDGQVPLDNVQVTLAYDPQLQPVSATEQYLGNRQAMGQFMLQWVIPRLEPQTSETLEAVFSAIATNQRSSLVLAAVSQQGARASKRLDFEILPSAVQQPQTPPSRPNLPPGRPGPTIPDASNAPAPAQPAPQPQPTQPAAEPKALGLVLTGPTTRVIVNQPIRYELRVTNPSDLPDSNILVKFNLPNAVKVRRVVQRIDPNNGVASMNENGGSVYIEIRTLRGRETLVYDIVLESNQPQTFQISAEALSENKEFGARSTVRTEVVPQP